MDVLSCDLAGCVTEGSAGGHRGVMAGAGQPGETRPYLLVLSTAACKRDAVAGFNMVP